MAEFMNSYEHRVAIGRRFGARISAGDAVFMSGASGVSEMPYTVTNGECRPVSGMNQLVLLQVMKDRGWRDPRFFTLAQVQEAGWTLSASATPIKLQFLVSTGADGMPMEAPSVMTFFVFNASEIDGVSAARKAPDVDVRHLELAVGRADVRGEKGGLRSDVCAWMGMLQQDQALPVADASLRVQLAATLLEVQAGLSVGEPVDAGLSLQWAKGIDADPLSFFQALKDAENLAAHVMGQVRAVGTEMLMATELARSSVKVDKPSAPSSTRIERLFEERATVLAVPFAEKDKAKALGAMWYGPQSLWFVPKGLDVAAFREWDVGNRCLDIGVSDAVKIDDFQKAMANMGLDTSKTPVPDGKWHNVSIESYKNGKNKSGSYILSLDGGRDGEAIGTILNKYTGERFVWRFEGEILTPEQRAKARAHALAREAAAMAEAAKVQDLAAVHADEIWSAGSPADGHGYVVRKGIPADGLRQVEGHVLLQYTEFKSETGYSIIRPAENYLIVPMTNAAGHLRAVQAISPDGAVKTFMRGAQKKGTMLVLGARSFDSLAELNAGDEVAYTEGIATGASFREASGGPVVVCFDAGNLETVVAETAPSLPQGVKCVLAVDNDQFFVERALGFLSDKLGVNPHVAGGKVLGVECGLRAVRPVALGDVIADGQWHQSAKGTYCVSAQGSGAGGAVRSVAVEIVPANGERKMRAVFENRGVEAGRVAMKSLDADRVVMVMPEFTSLAHRPTDWNDLAKIEGVDAVRAVLREAGLVLKAVNERPMDVNRGTRQPCAGISR